MKRSSEGLSGEGRYIQRPPRSQEGFQMKLVRINKATNQDLLPRKKKFRFSLVQKTTRVRNRLIAINILFLELEKLLSSQTCKIKVVCIERGQLLAINSCK